MEWHWTPKTGKSASKSGSLCSNSLFSRRNKNKNTRKTNSKAICRVLQNPKIKRATISQTPGTVRTSSAQIVFKWPKSWGKWLTDASLTLKTEGWVPQSTSEPTHQKENWAISPQTKKDGLVSHWSFQMIWEIQKVQLLMLEAITQELLYFPFHSASFEKKHGNHFKEPAQSKILGHWEWAKEFATFEFGFDCPRTSEQSRKTRESSTKNQSNWKLSKEKCWLSHHRNEQKSLQKLRGSWNFRMKRKSEESSGSTRNEE